MLNSSPRLFSTFLFLCDQIQIYLKWNHSMEIIICLFFKLKLYLLQKQFRIGVGIY